MSDTERPVDGPDPEDVLDAEVVDAEVVPPGTPVVDVTAVTADAILAPPVDTGYTAAGVPTFDSVRDKIETRIGTAIGAAELAAETPEGRSVEELYEARQKAAADRLAEIRAAMTATDEP